MTVKLAKIKIDHANMRKFLGLPEDVTITSVYTGRHRREPRDLYSYVYVVSNRFKEIGDYDLAPEISFRDAQSDGEWDIENNE